MKLSTYLEANGLSAAEFGRRIGKTRQAVAKWLSGERIPRRAEMQLINQQTAGAVTANDFMAANPPATGGEEAA